MCTGVFCKIKGSYLIIHILFLLFYISIHSIPSYLGPLTLTETLISGNFSVTPGHI